MISPKSLPCFDAGSDYCPCILATLGQCIACSMLRGENSCDCGWSGVCIYAEYMRTNKKAKPRREQFIAEITNISFLKTGKNQHDAFILDIAVPSNISLSCGLPGSFVLLRPKGDEKMFNVPISVMDTSLHEIRVAVECRGPKTIALKQAVQTNKYLTVTGPFWSGLQGYEKFARLSARNCVVIAKGIAQAAVPSIARFIKNQGGQIKVLIGPGTLGTVFIDHTLINYGITFEVLPRLKDHNQERIRKEIETGSCDLLISAGAKSQHQGILDLINIASQKNNPVPQFLWVSHLTMACAEGICGTCLLAGFRGCKARFNNHFETHLMQ